MKETVKTVLIVGVLSCLIWVLAERAVSKSATIHATIELINNRDDLLVQVLDENRQPKMDFNQQIEVELQVQGPAALIQTVQGTTFRLPIPLNMEKYAPKNQDDLESTLWITDDLLQGRLLIEDKFLQVIESTPSKQDIRVVQLIKQPLPITAITVFDTDGVKLDAVIEPDTYEAYVMRGSQPKARVVLTPEQINIARQATIKVTGQVDLPGNQARQFDKPIQIRLPKEEILWSTENIMLPRLGILISPEMSQKWRVEVDQNALKEYSSISCRGTVQATKEYINSQYHLILVIKEEDAKKSENYRPPRYLIPEGFEGKLEILDRKQVPIPFKLVPLTENPPPTP